MRSRRTRRDRPHLDRVWAGHEASVDDAYEQAAQAQLTELRVAGDEVLGSAVDGLVATRRAAGAADAWRAEQVNQVRRAAELNVLVTTSRGMRPWSQEATARRVAVSEVAAALSIPERSAQTLIEESRTLVDEMPATLEGLRAGTFSYRRAKTIIDHAGSLGGEFRAEFEAKVLPFAATLTPSKFEQKARTMRERMDAATITERHARAVGDREVSWEPARDGMGWVHYYDTAAKTRAAYDRLTDLARTFDGPAEERTLAQRRADVTGDLLIDGEVPQTGVVGVKAAVVLTIPVMSLLGRPSAEGHVEPATLDGYGPIDIETAKRLMGNTNSWLRVLTHPITGVALTVERRKRKIPAALRRLLGLRDGTCRKVGCNKPVKHCDLDHTQEWQNGGRNAHDNLSHLCPAHHDEKHHTPIRMQHLPDGTIEWTMPSGHIYIDEPEMRMDAFTNPARTQTALRISH
jgi:Domain of unknown function (DUF222)